MKIVLEDNHILVAVKPGGITTQGEEGFEGHLKSYIKKRDRKPGNVFLHAIHRLDKPVAGLVLFAKTSKALSRLNQQMRNQKIIRKYQGEIEGEFFGSGEWHFYHRKENYRAEISTIPCKMSKEVCMKYQAKGNIIQIEMGTGKYHQIRAVLSFLGFPIVGDAKYGSSIKTKQIKLSCSYLSLVHPIQIHEGVPKIIEIFETPKHKSV
jgi:23S rRNA pseudouridine1911/1915/1917 synthase